MPLPREDNELVASIYRVLDPFYSLPAESPFYEPIYQNQEIPDIEDPMAQLQWHIDTTYHESIQFFSGYRGSGKTTELYRLKKNLEDSGYLVFYANVLDYINPSEPISITDMLLVIAGAFSDELDRHLGGSSGTPSYWERLMVFLKSEVELKDFTVKGDVESPLKDFIGGGKLAADLKLGLRSTPSFRQALQSFLGARLSEVKRESDMFIEEGGKRLRAKFGEETKIVFILDQLEQVRGSLFNQDAVIQSVETLFGQHLEKLRLPYLHTIYTVPPWLHFVHPGLSRVFILPSIRLWDRSEKRVKCEAGWAVMHRLIEKRFGSRENVERIFGPYTSDYTHPLLDQLIRLCGGYIRDLFRLLQETLMRVAQTPALPVTERILQHAITQVREQYRPIAVEDSRWLAQIAKERRELLRNTSGEAVDQLARFLDTHVVLYFRNGEGWYDIHPLIREEVLYLAGLDLSHLES